MAKTKTRYVCSNCGATYIKYQGKCNECQSWGTLVEEVVKEEKEAKKHSSGVGRLNTFATPRRLKEIDTLKEERVSTGIKEFDHVLGGGLMAASVVLIGGEPGIGKSTLMLQIVPIFPIKKFSMSRQKNPFIKSEIALSAWALSPTTSFSFPKLNLKPF